MTKPKPGPWRAVKENNWYFAEHFEESKRQGPFNSRKDADEFVDIKNSALAEEEVDFRRDVED